MRKKIDHFLLSVLWLLAMTLGGAFWFNAKFGFNIFYKPHWQYLGQIQAANATIDSSFYLSMIIIIFFMIFGIYIILRPKFRRFRLNTQIEKTPETMHSEPAIEIIPATDTPIIETPMVRPPRLVLPKMSANNFAPQNDMAQPTAVPSISVPTVTPAMITPSVDFSELESIFTDNGYLVKKSPQIGNMRPALFAIGPDETLWIGAVGVSPATIMNSVDKLQTIFTDTLEDITISIYPFIIVSRDGIPAEYADTLKTFDTTDDLRNYMAGHPARLIPDSESEDFAAYSDYIDTVAEHVNKL